ncbi:unnamed protein product, partial [Rotaria magnacalcarata]
MTTICIICFNNHAEDDCPDFVSSSRMNGTEKKPSSSLTRNLSKIPRGHAANRCRHAVDDLDAAFNAAILDGDLRDVVIDALSRAEMIASNIDLARDEDGFAILKVTKAVREAQRDH